ncbi:MAG: hemolysin [Bacteroidia bacterium]|nr:MAG: hemolysin [Bacteroidia bacterium]
MKEIIPATDKHLIVAELTQDKFMRKTNFGNNSIYICTAHNSPNVMREIGRLREIAFRQTGGGTGKSYDVDAYDTAEIPYSQLIVWDSESMEITGGYRFLELNRLNAEQLQNIRLATQGIFSFSQKFIQNYLPYTIELGRSFVQPKFQAGNSGRKALYALDNLWDGLGVLVNRNPKMRYFFGKVTMYPDFDKFARDLVLYFLQLHFGDKENLVFPQKKLSYFHPEEELAAYFPTTDFATNKKILSSEVRKRGENIPPLINSYMSLSDTMKCFGTAINPGFGNVEETGILLTVSDIYESKKKRHL